MIKVASAPDIFACFEQIEAGRFLVTIVAPTPQGSKYGRGGARVVSALNSFDLVKRIQAACNGDRMA